MTDKIALTASMRSNLLSLKNTQNLMNKTQDRLSTGYKVNSAMDNPSSYFTAQALNSRASDLSTLLDSIGQAISTLEVADQGITTLQDFVEQAKSVAQSARDTSNVSANVASNIKFNMDTLRSDLVTNQVNGVAANDTMTIRVGDSTKLTGTANVRDTTSIDLASATPPGLNLDQTAVAFTAGAWTAGGAGSITVDGQEYIIDASSNGTPKMETTATFGANSALTVKSVDAANDTATVVDVDGNEYVIDNSTLTATAGQSITTSAGTIVTTVNNDGTTTAVATGFTAGAHVDDAGSASTTGPVIFVKNDGTVGEMAETIQNMIGNTKISVSVEDSNLTIKTLDTTAVEIKEPPALTAGTASLSSAFGLDKGTTIQLDASDTAESLRQKIAGIDGVTAEFDKTGHLVIKSEQGDDLVISGALADGLGVSGAATNGNNERAAYASQFNNILTQIDELVQDTSYKGINLLKGDNLTVNFNENRTSSLELKGVTFDSVGLGFTAAANEWIDNNSIDKALDQISKATSMLRAQASEFGQNLSTVQIREDFTQNMINNLQSGADKLTLADMNEEAANMLALQTRQQLGVNSLSLASQASQSVLRLF